MLTKIEKQEVIDRIRNEINSNSTVILTNLVGIPANDAVRIRKLVRSSNGKIMITKNRLFQKAAKGTHCEELVRNLKGPHALVFAGAESPSVAKILHDASKQFSSVGLFAGVLEGKSLKPEDLVSLANLPSKDQMLATLLATFNAPISAFVRALEAIRKQKEEIAS